MFFLASPRSTTFPQTAAALYKNCSTFFFDTLAQAQRQEKGHLDGGRAGRQGSKIHQPHVATIMPSRNAHFRITTAGAISRAYKAPLLLVVFGTVPCVSIRFCSPLTVFLLEFKGKRERERDYGEEMCYVACRLVLANRDPVTVCSRWQKGMLASFWYSIRKQLSHSLSAFV